MYQRPQKMTRREMLTTTSTGFGLMALSDLMTRDAQGGAPSLHHDAKAKHVVFCYMSGGVSHIDSFDPKPKLKELAGEPMPVRIERTQFNNNGNVMPCPFDFLQYGESGIPVSSIFSEIGSVVDELAVVRSMTTAVNEHAQGNYAMHTGFPFMGHPSAGAWISYGLGTENENLPSFVALESGDAVPPHEVPNIPTEPSQFRSIGSVHSSVAPGLMLSSVSSQSSSPIPYPSGASHAVTESVPAP